MTPEEERGRAMARRTAAGCVWFLVECCVLAVIIKLAARDDVGAAWALGIFLVLLCYFEGRMRK